MERKVKFQAASERKRTAGARPFHGGARAKRLRFRGFLAAGLWVLAFLPWRGEGAELVMFETSSCQWCKVWDQEVGVVYHKTDEGRTAPLRRVSIDDLRPGDLASIEGIRYSPTFVLLQQGREVGRIVGYPGEDHFWGLLQDLLNELAPSPGAKYLGGTQP